MANIRDLIDGKAVDTSDTGDVYNHLKKTKLAQLNYDLAKTQLHTKLAPTRQLLDLVDKDHPVDDGQEKETDQFGNPVGVQNKNTPQAKPGMLTNPNNPNQQTNRNIQQQQQNKQVAAPNKTNASPNGKENNQKKKLPGKKNNGQGFEVHVKANRLTAGGPGSGRHGGLSSAIKKHKDLSEEHSNLDNKKDLSLKESLRMDKLERILDDIEQSYPNHNFERTSRINSSSKKIDKLDVKKMQSEDYHNDAGKSMMPSRGVGLSGGGPGSGRHAHEGLHNVLTKAGYTHTNFNGTKSLYSHPNRGGITTFKDGKWKSSSEKGTGYGSLLSYIKDHNSKLQAGGPGSGRKSTGEHSNSKSFGTKVGSHKGFTLHNEPWAKSHPAYSPTRIVVRDKRGNKWGQHFDSIKEAKDEIDMFKD